MRALSRALSEGRIMVVTKRWRGMRWTQAVSKTNGTDADGKAVWSWRPTLASSPVEFIHKATVANKPDHRGERGISRKPLCRGCPGASAEPVCSCAPLLPLRMRPRVQRAPGIPCALWLMEGQVFEQNSDAFVSRECALTSHRRHSGARSEAERTRNPYSRSWLWIPGLRQEEHPGMTRLSFLVGKNNRP